MLFYSVPALPSLYNEYIRKSFSFLPNNSKEDVEERVESPRTSKISRVDCLNEEVILPSFEDFSFEENLPPKSLEQWEGEEGGGGGIENSCLFQSRLVRQETKLLIEDFSVQPIFLAGEFSVVSFSDILIPLLYSQKEDMLDNLSSHPFLQTANKWMLLLQNGIISTNYSHDNSIKEDERLSLNCYGFIGELVRLTVPQAFIELGKMMQELTLKGIERTLDRDLPSPYNYFHIFNYLVQGKLTSPLWEGISDISLLRPGDLLVYMKPSFSSPTIWKKNEGPTGTHVMIICQGLGKSGKYNKFLIMDATRNAHNKIEDTRHLFNHTQGGVGVSSLFIKKLEGKTYRLKWSERKQDSLKKELIAGRVKLDALELKEREE